MKQAFKKVLAIVLTVAMIQGTGGFFSFADTTDAARDAESAQPGVTVEEREVKAEDPGTEESGAQEEKAEEPQEASGQSGDEDGQAEEAVTDQKEQEEQAGSEADQEGSEAGQAEERSDEEAEEKAEEKTAYEYSDDKIQVNVVISDPSAVPDSARLEVKRVTSKTEGYDYDAYMDALNGKAEKGQEYTKDNTLLYDIAFMDGGKEIEPAEGSVNVQVKFKDKQLSEGLNATAKDDVQIMHLPLKKSVQEGFATTAEATEIEAADIKVEPVDAEVSVGKKESTSFTTKTFSVWAWSNGAASTIKIPEIEGEFGPGAPQYELNGPFGSLANFGVVGFSEIVQNDHLHSNFATKNYVMNSAVGFGLRDKRNGVTNTHKELYYIGESLTGDASTSNMEIHVPDSLLVFGHDLGENGRLIAAPNDDTYDINVSGRNIHITSGEAAAKRDGSGYSATSIRQEPEGSKYVDLDKMKAEAEKLSKTLSDRTASEVTVTPGENNVLIVESPNATIGCMNFNASDFEGKTLKIDEASIANREHLLIINIDAAGAGSITLPQLELQNAGGIYNGEVVEWTKGNVVVNVIDSTKPDKLFRGTVNTVAGLFQASILAPDANVIVNASVNGQVFGDRVELNMEFHRDSITFKNSIPSVGGIRVAKTMDGSNIVKPDTYSFKLEGLNYNGHQAPMPDGSNGNVKTMYAQADGLVSFGFLNFSEDEFNAGVRDYRYRISEVIPSNATDIGDGYKLSGDVAYDSSQYIIELHTKRSSSGGLSIGGYTVYEADGKTKIAEMTYEESKTSGVATFDNKSLSNQSKIILKVKKAFNSDEWPEGGFGFDLTKVGVDYGQGIDSSQLDNMPPEKWRIDSTYEPQKFYTHITATKDKPTAVFREIEYNRTGTYYYKIKETIPAGATVSPDGKTAVKDGITYDRTEHDVAVTIKQINGKNIASVKYDGKSSLKITNSVEEQTGNLELTKTIKGDITEEEAEGALTFVVKTKDGKYLDKDGKLSDQKVELTLADFQHEEGTKEYTLKIEGVDLGNYTVTETTKDVDGKDVTTTYKVNGGEAATGDSAEAEVKKDETTTVAFEDDYTKQTGNLELTKTIKGDITEEEAEGALTFVVKAENGKYLDKDGKLVESEKDVVLTLADFQHEEGTDKYTFTAEGIDIGEYTVTETTKTIDGKDVTTTYKVNGGEAATGDSAEAEVKKDETTTVAFEDDYTKQTGNLELTKTIKGDITEEEAEGALTFVVKTKDGKYLDKDGKLVESEKDVVLTLADFQHEEGTDKYTFTAEGIDIGEYTVTETTKTIDGKDVTVTYSVNGGEATEGKAAPAEVEKDKTTIVAFEDDYTKQTGNLELTKTIKGDITEEEAEGALTFVVKTKDEKYLDKDGKLVESEKDVVLTLADFQHEEGTDKYTFTAEGIDIGEYTVTETTKDIDGKEVKVTYKVNGGEAAEGDEAEAEIRDGETTTVAFEDDYTATTQTESGILELTKTIKGDITEEEAEGALTFVVKAENGKYLNKDGELVDDETTLTLADFQHEEGTKEYTLKIEGVDLGNYKVTETTKDIDGKDVTVTYSVNGGEAKEGKEAAAEVEKEKTTTVAFEDDYSKQTGNLELTKTIKGDITEEEAEGALTFVVKTKDGKYLGKDGKLVDSEEEGTLTLKDFEKIGDNEYKLTIKDVDLGNYTVTETTKTIDGKDVTVTYKVNDGEVTEGKAAAAEVKKDETTTVAFEDDYTATTQKESGILELTKTIKGDITEEEAEGALTFVVKAENGKYLGKDGKLVDSEEEGTLTLKDFEKIGDNEYKLTIKDVDLGNYTVTETTKDIDGKDVTVKYSVNGGEATEGKEAAAEVEKDKTTTVAFEDDYTATTQKESGILELTKTIKGDITEEEAEGALTFVVKAENGKYLNKDGELVGEETTLTLADFQHEEGTKEYTLKIEGVDLGNYTVTETTKDIDGKDVKVTYSVNGGETTEGKEAAAEVEKDKTTTVAFEDDYTKQTGSLELTKTIKGDITEEEAEGALTFVVKAENGKYLNKDGELVGEETTLTLADFQHEEGTKEYTLKIEGVDLGNYTVTETTKDVDGRDVTTTYKVNGGEAATGDSAEAEVKKDETTTVAFEDDYKDKPGDLVITKSIDGLNVTESEFEGALKFTVQNEDGKYLDKDGNLSDEKVELTLKDGGFVKGEDGTYTKTFKDVAPGKYTVKETNSDVEGYDLVTEESTTEGEGTVEAGKAATVELKDVYEEKTSQESGDLVITKSIDGLNVTESEFEGALKFTVQNSEGKYLDKDGTLSDEKVELTLKDGGFVKGEDGTYTKTFKDVAPGKYTVKETNSDVEGYDLVTEESTTEGEGTVEAGKAETVELKDVYEEKPGDLVITKSIDGLNVTESEFEGALKFTVQNSEGKYLDKDGNLSDEKVELTLKDGGFVKGENGTYTKTFKDVAPGKYTVKETNSDVEGYDLVTEDSTTEGEGTVEAGKAATVELKDLYEEKPGDLVITKSIDGLNVTESEFEGALKFTAQNEDGKYLDKDGNLSDEKVELTLKDGGFVKGEDGTYTKTFKDVAPGKYTVKETNSDVEGYDLVKEESTTEGEGTVKGGKTETVELKDVYEEKPGDLVITKSIDGLNVTESEFEGALKFTVQNEDGKYLDKDGNLSDEKVELTLKDGGFVKGEDGTYTKTFKDVAPGKYTVKETNSDVEGYDFVTEDSTTEGEGTVEAGKAATVELKDVYEEKTSQKSGILELTKTIKGDVTEEEAEGTLTFVVMTEDGKYLDKDGKLVDSEEEGTLTLKDFEKTGENEYKLTIKDVDLGNYTVTETTKDIDGKEVKVTYSVNGGEAAEGDEAEAEVKDGETTTVAFEDDYTKVSKPADGDDEEGATDDSGDSDGSDESSSKPTEAQTPQTPTSEAGSESGSDKDSKSGSSARPGAGARTGDEAPIGVITALMLASLTAIGGSLVFTRRRRKADEDAGKK